MATGIIESMVHARFNMKIMLYPQVTTVNEDTGQVRRAWSYQEPGGIQNYDYGNGVEEDALVRGVISEGIRTVGATERWGSEVYESINWIRIFVPPHVRITQRYRVGNIRDAHGNLLWRDAQREADMDIEQIPLVFNVYGVQDVLDPFGRVIEKFVLAEKAEAP